MKLLLIRLSSLGDLILLSSVFSPLKEAGAKVHLLSYKEGEVLYQKDERISKVITVNKETFRSLRKIKLLSAKLNEENYDFVFDLHGILKTRLLSLFLKPPVLRYKKHSFLRRLTLYFKPLKAKWLFVPELYGEPFRKIGVEIKTPRPFIPIKKEEIKKVKQFIPQKEFVVVAPGAKWETKRYPEDKFIKVVQLFKKENLEVVVLGGKEEFKLGERISRKTGAINLCGKLSVRESLALISQSLSVVSNDSAVVHMARAVKKPVVAIFGPTHPVFGFAPAEDEGISLTLNLPCSPCSLHGKTNCKKQRCFEIPPEEVVKKTLALTQPSP